MSCIVAICHKVVFIYAYHQNCIQDLSKLSEYKGAIKRASLFHIRLGDVVAIELKSFTYVTLSQGGNRSLRDLFICYIIKHRLNQASLKLW